MTIDSRILWRLADHAELRERCADGEAAWLAPNERRELELLRNTDRRGQWLMGRFLAKQMVLEHVGYSFERAQTIEICSRDAEGRSVRPRVTVAGQVQPWSLSISHTQAAALVALCPARGLRVGVDLVQVIELSPGFLETWFDADERALLPADNPLESCRLWALKEAVYKAANHDEPFAPRQIGIRRAADGTYACSYCGVDLAERCGLVTWTHADHVAALAALADAKPSTHDPQPPALPGDSSS